MASKLCPRLGDCSPDDHNQVRGYRENKALEDFPPSRLINKLSESYLSATLSTTERHYGFKTKEMSLVRK